MSSSMKLLNDPITRHGLVVIPKQQITGIGKTIYFLISTLYFLLKLQRIRTIYEIICILYPIVLKHSLS